MAKRIEAADQTKITSGPGGKEIYTTLHRAPPRDLSWVSVGGSGLEWAVLAERVAVTLRNGCEEVILGLGTHNTTNHQICTKVLIWATLCSALNLG